MEIIIWMIIGAIIGWVLFLFMKPDSERSVAFGIIIGALGALVGGWLASFFGGVTGLSFYGLLAVAVGAIVFAGAAGVVQSA